MKISFLSTALALASLSAHAVADVTLGPFPDLVNVGDTYTLSWTATENYTYSLWLVVETAGEGGYGWSKAQGLDTGMEFDHLEGSYTWTVTPNLTSHNEYSLWLYGLAIPFDGSSYASMTDWFRVSFTNYNNNQTSTVPPSSTATSTPSSTSTRATVTLTPTSFNSPTATSSPSSSHVSGGAIAGIVIGVLALIALAVGAFILMKWRKKRTAQQKREAAARDSRLQPVMRVGTEQGDFEMDGRNPQANKDFAV